MQIAVIAHLINQLISLGQVKALKAGATSLLVKCKEKLRPGANLLARVGSRWA